MMNHEELAARRYLYEAFHVLLGEDPASEAWNALDDALFADACDIMGIPAPSGALDLMAQARDDAKVRASIAGEYTRALVGPGALPSPPWESVQVTGEGALFSLVTLGVRNAYRAQGLLPSAYPAVSDDHIALECGFLAALAERALVAYEQGDADQCVETLAASREFLQAHPLQWVDTFAKGLATTTCTFYAPVAETLASFMHTDATRIQAAITLIA